MDYSALPLDLGGGWVRMCFRPKTAQLLSRAAERLQVPFFVFTRPTLLT